MSTISVIVPVYKVEKYIHRCVDSILNQTYRDFELILVDDGSPDNCGAICDEYAVEDDRVVVIHQENGGLSAARNAGIDWVFANSDSEWLTFVDSDDWIHSEYLSLLLNAATQYQVKVSICEFIRTDGTDVVPACKFPRPALWDVEEYYLNNSANLNIACAKLYQKECFRQIRYPLGKIHEDEFTTYQITFASPTISVLSFPLYYYFQNTSGIMHSAWSPKRLDVLDALDGQATLYKQQNYLRAYQYNTNLRARNALRQKQNLQKAELSREDQTRYLKLIKTYLRRLLMNNRRLFPIQNHYEEYETAFPRLMHFYWFLLSVKNKLRLLK